VILRLICEPSLTCASVRIVNAMGWASSGSDRAIARRDHVAMDEVIGRDREVPRDDEIGRRKSRGVERVEDVGEPRARRFEQAVIGVLVVAQRREAGRDRELATVGRLHAIRDRDRVAMAADQPLRRAK